MKDVTSSALELQTSEEDLSISRFYCLNNKHASLGQGGVRRGEAGGGGLNKLHYRPLQMQCH